MPDMVRVPKGTPQQQYQAPRMSLGRSQFSFDRNHTTSFNVGDLVPYFVEEVVPGDTHTLKLNAFLRVFSPLDAPIMDNIHVDIDYFFVPNRIIWENWTSFLGEHKDGAGAQDTDYTVPVLASGHTVPQSSDGVLSYMGVPRGLQTSGQGVNVLPLRAYNLCYQEWYRDQNLIAPIPVPLGDGPDSIGNYPIRKSAKRPDYFTTALPYLQKGDPSMVALSGTAPVSFGTGLVTGAPVTIRDQQTGLYRKLEATASSNDEVVLDSGTSSAGRNLFADLDESTSGITINALREAAAIQRLLERDARGGTRHPEIIEAHFGVSVPDMRTQRPEYLGGGSGFINISPVANTAGGTVDQGTLAGVGAGTLGGSFAKSFVEHGYIIGILRARGEISYQQGLERMWSRSTKYDFLWPELAQLGEQPIYNRELFVANTSVDDEVFGYQERYADYRFRKSLVTGKFASDAVGSLDYWHLSEDFANTPGLNQTFIEDATPMDRVVTVTTEPHFIVDGRFQHRVARALPVRPTPTLAPARF